jgi:hypothetical protein
MPITYNNARDEMFGIIKAAWSGSTDVVGYEPDIRWQGAPQGSAPDMDKYWARVSIQIVTDKQETLASDSLGKRLYKATGLIYFQLFCPRNVANPTINGITLAELIRGAFRKASPSGSIFFYNQAIRELPPTDENYPINVVATFEYDTIQ